MNNKTKKILIIISIIILLLIFMITVLLKVLQTNANKVEGNEIANSKSLTISELEKMKDSELANLFYNISVENEFANTASKDYVFGYKCVASEEEALEKAKKIGQSDNTELLELKLAEETDYYYIIYQKYISHRETQNIIFEYNYLFFKNSILDINNKIINVNILNDINKIKEIFDVYTYAKSIENKSIKLLLSEITENQNEYIYTCYYFDTTYGDWGLSDEIILYQDIITINKKSGKYEPIQNKLREVTGKFNEEPYYINIE